MKRVKPLCNMLYRIVFLQGDPMMILMIVISGVLIRVGYARVKGSTYRGD